MNMEQIMEQLDMLYSEQKIHEVKALLEGKIAELTANEEIYPTISLRNELLGVYRELGEREQGLSCCANLLDLFETHRLPQDENYGTTLLNVATAQRAFGNFQQSKEYYEKCLAIFKDKIPSNDYRYASLYNNMSLLFSEMDDIPKAISYIEQSLEILEQHDHMEVQQATGNTSLAQMYLNLEDMATAEKHIDIALKLFENVEDYHYSATLATAASIAFLKKNIPLSAELYKKAMEEIEKYVGKSENYKTLEENFLYVQSLIGEKKNPQGLLMCKEFFYEFGLPMIEEKFPNYLDKMAMGLVGQGSECLRMDDHISTDHDFGAGFCIWLRDEDYAEIGEALQTAYEKLPDTYKGFTRGTSGEKRVGVFSIGGFYQSFLGLPHAPEIEDHWMLMEEHQLAQVTNGEVFVDNLGLFTKIREQLLAYYPSSVLNKRIAEKIHLVSQLGQYNFQRMLRRGDKVTAQIILADFMSHTMDLVFLLNKTYAPFYKWKLQKMKELPILSQISAKLEQLQTLPLESGTVVTVIEEIACQLIEQLKAQGYIEEILQGNFLDKYVHEVAYKE